MYSEGLAVIGALLTAGGVMFVGVGATGGMFRRRSKKPLGGDLPWDICTCVGAAASIIGAVLSFLALVVL
ncbi:hypothetical protein [Brachybacterium paraconglomeratum]|uniref:hypothetical protein n=1 Tax=Brachybacterium paraconglomeratum TaxID=173362 RepID=UPI00248FA30C|nr:hypothetical protein [Brachybacterium paraconglomeratum]